MALWHNKRGDFSSLRAATLFALSLPALFGLYYTLTNDWGPRPFEEITHYSGLWGIRILALSYLVTPLRRMGRWPRLIDVRRMIGVACFIYLVFHFSLYIVDQAFNLVTVATEIVLRIYLTIGFVTFAGIAALAVTSNDYMVRRMGGMRWRKLHWLVHPILVLGLIHNFMQSKLDMFQPTMLTGIVLFAVAYRIIHWRVPRERKNAFGELPLWGLTLLGLGTVAAIILGEVIGYWIAYDVPPLAFLQFYVDFGAGIRAGWFVLAACTAFVAIAAIRQRPDARRHELAPA
jgi:sulfoxide reductase heme-binding subunit YedZ